MNTLLSYTVNDPSEKAEAVQEEIVDIMGVVCAEWHYLLVIIMDERSVLCCVRIWRINQKVNEWNLLRIGVM